MGENSKIAWTDHTFNPWIGCQKVSAGCENCYAERQNAFYKWVPEWGKGYYHRTSEANWKKPIQWARQAVNDGVIRRVFCASLADVFDENVPMEWKDDLFELILETHEMGGLEWLLLTKRPENLRAALPVDFDLDSVRIGVTAENQEMANKRIPELLKSWSGKNFVSYEPALELVDFEPFLQGEPLTENYKMNFGMSEFEGINWIICGSESGTNARPFDIDWARSVRNQCIEYEIPFFLKQMPVDGKLTILPELDGKIWNEFPRTE